MKFLCNLGIHKHDWNMNGYGDVISECSRCNKVYVLQVAASAGGCASVSHIKYDSMGHYIVHMLEKYKDETEILQNYEKERGSANQG
jgi:hypothetical protein